ncbi:MAG: hypothetical protein RL417_1320 [Pseudomonadota bacterium]|jgi:hypothetical protein
MGTRTFVSAKSVSFIVWILCLSVVAIHGGCGGGTSGTGVKALVTGTVEASGASSIDIIGADGAVLATVALNPNGTWSAGLPDGSGITAIAIAGVAYPTPGLVVVSTAVLTVLYTSPPSGTTVASQVENTPTPTSHSGGGQTATPAPEPTSTRLSRATPTPTINATVYCAANPNRPACATPTATPTIDPTAYCAANPNRPACATPTATPTIDPTAYCAANPNRPACWTRTPTPTP